MDALIISFYWFLNGVLLVVFVGRCFKIRENTIRWCLGFFLACLLCLFLLFGAVMLFDHFLQTLLF